MPSAPFSISTQSRNKLQTYILEANPIDSQQVDDKENINVDLSRCASLVGSQRLHDDALQKSSPQLPPLSSEKPCPQTPANRIPLADLIGNTEDAFNCNPKDTTPEDHICWQHGPTPLSSIPSATANSTRRGKKRARSSSPTTSSQNQKSTRSNAQETLDLKILHESLKTPQNDPALDLWARYTDASLTKKDADGNALPAFAHLMTSSPQTPSTANGKDGGLRRSISCGIEWPVSKAKKRKLNQEAAEGRLKDVFEASKTDIIGPKKSKASRITLLMEKLQENSRKVPQIEVSGPSSSSPLPDRIGLSTVPLLSPVSRRFAAQQEYDEAVTTEGNGQTMHDMPAQQHDDPGSRSSEFGDEDLALDVLEAVEQSAGTQVALSATGKQGCESLTRMENITRQIHAGPGHQSSPPQSSYRRCPEILLPRSEVQGGVDNRASANVTPSAFNGDDDDDEFGDGSDDNGVLADLAARFDTQQSTGDPPRQTHVKQILVQQDVGYNNNPTTAQAADDDDDTYDDDGDDDLWNQIGDGSLVLQQESGVATASQSRSTTNRTIKRYLVVDVAESHYLNAKGRQQPEKMLSVKDEKTGMLKVILLRQAWLDSRCTKGSHVHLIGHFDHLGQCIVDDHENMIILHPDHLISATVVADSFSCTRRAVLQDRIKATGAAEPSQVYGHILHEIFGQALKANDWSLESLSIIIERILVNWIESLYEINTPVPQALEYLLSKMPELQAWASVFVTAQASPQGEVRDRNGGISNMSVNKLLEVEEHIWSPMFGLKGNIDATIQVTLQEANEPRTQTLTVPLEFKTGKKDNSEMHRAQTALYTLLLSDRYDINVTCGVLYYLETSKTFRVQAVRNELRHMIIQRNELACYVRNKLELPPLIRKPFLCNRCYAQTACFTYHKLIDGGDGETSGLKEKFENAVSHLKPVHQAFFQKWDELLTKEERDAMKFRRELWTMLSEEREALGRCFGRVYIEPGSVVGSPDGPKINRYEYTFLKQTPRAGFSFAESQLTVGEPIVVSDEKGHFALANGYITKVRSTRLTVAVDRKLHQMRKKCPGFNPDTNQVFQGIMEVPNDEDSRTTAVTAGEVGDAMLFRVDKDEFSNGMATVRNNLIRIMEKDLFKARELRQLIVEAAAPSFKPTSSAYPPAGPGSQQNLNVDQVHAIEKVMSAKDYALVLGMPGTGKTTTIAHIIRALVSQGKSVLLTSYTHTAVDNILLKIKDDDIPVLRLGAVAKVHPEVQSFADLAGIPKKTIAELEESYVHSRVVASTCLGVNHPIFNTRIFDYCIVDEASQITLPTCLGPIRMAKTFILVGDHFQLPPLVQNKEAQQGGLDISLFKMLSEAQPDSVVNLEHQYRMAEDIMLLSNTLVYNGRLKCGTPSIATRTLCIPNLGAGLAAHHHTPGSFTSSSKSTSVCLQTPTCWILRSLTPSSRCLFLNTDPLLPSSHDTISGSRITNPLEATLTTLLVQTLLSSGIPARSVGVITFYRSQLALLRQTLGRITDLEMHTADKFQGRDKEVVILSCVRSNEARSVGELLKDWRRVNVAITRAKSKLLILGSQATLGGCGNETLEGLVRLMEAKGWVLHLPRDAVEGHVWEGAALATQTQTQPHTHTQSRMQKSDTMDQLGTSPKKKRAANGSDLLSPSKKRKVNALPPFKQPTKRVNGSLAQAERVLGRSGIMQDIVNGM
ncbi:hypothetical protein EPUS_01509 [Endocarpon pusillum Z07020]|uniref:DNA replication ATP-dependent helicase/nuclease n=1 Tax=Endocarpon pusillum (strain Z07020 / HMAS-L-300199) TaxID=1263415 RepID=U1HZ63_ENDPU|nr:uncharacterized protein EPUS_01509 [Endocarpon pusillum Z07020]ERF76175.1 hypothetical protein EPUS_01509 [Endocarpon pusillum Z07020]